MRIKMRIKKRKMISISKLKAGLELKGGLVNFPNKKPNPVTYQVWK
jgi:hypothetical protein